MSALRRITLLLVVVLVGTLASGSASGGAEVVWLDRLDLSLVRQGWGRAQADRSVTGGPLTIGGKRFERGVGTHSESTLCVLLGGRGRRFLARVGVDGDVASGHGSVEFLVRGDGECLWRSGILRSGDPARSVDVGLRGVRRLDLVVTDALDSEDEDHADWAEARIELRAPGPVRLAPFVYSIEVDPSETKQVIDGFGASDGWTFQRLGDWSEAARRRVADLLFSREKGIGLSVWRFDTGAGFCDEISRSLRSTESFETAPGEYDWTRKKGQRWFLRAAKARGVERFVAFCLSPPARMTRNGLTFCSPGESTNLADGAEKAYARYLVDILRHFADAPDPAERIVFDHVSPVNEPQWDWNQGAQEGNRAANDDLRRIYRALGLELDRRHLKTRILPFESGSPAGMLSVDKRATDRYGKTYGNYLEEFCDDARFRERCGGVAAYHSYWADSLNDMVRQRRKLGEALARHEGWRLWQTEYCVLRGPRGETGAGRDLSMTPAIWVARILHFDLTLADVSSWQWWRALSPADYKDGLLYTDWRKAGDPESVLESKLLWAYGNFSRFVRPGMNRVGLTGANYSVSGLLVSAYARPEGGPLVVVLVNPRSREERISVGTGGPATARFRPYLTSEGKGVDLLEGEPFAGEYVVPPRSVVTLVEEK